MRNALPNAAFLGFTGTPLIAGEEERTREVFGDYVSVYDFARSIEDGATVPLYYENRTPELQITNDDLNRDIERLLEEAELDEEQEKKLEREFAREYHLITRDDRLETIAADLVKHFLGRGYRGKAMMVCIDKATAVRMYDKVQAHWKQHLAELQAQLKTATGDTREALADKIMVMQTTDMAVVVSQSQNEIDDLKAKGLDIVPHRQRMVSENLDEQFKDPDGPLRLVFVCAMWITGFDVPTCSTLYLDKPMRTHHFQEQIECWPVLLEHRDIGVLLRDEVLDDPRQLWNLGGRFGRLPCRGRFDPFPLRPGLHGLRGLLGAPEELNRELFELG